MKLDRTGTPKKIAKALPMTDYQRLERRAHQQERYLHTLVAALVIIILGLFIRAVR